MPEQTEIHEKSISEKIEDRREAPSLMETYFSNFSDKNQAWQDLVRLTRDKYSPVRREAAYALESIVNQVPDKDQAWQDIIRLNQDKYSTVRRAAALVLVSAFNQITDKDQAWQDLRMLTKSKDSDVRMRAAYALGTAFNQVTDKVRAWQDLHRLTKDEDCNVRWGAAYSLVSAFNQIPNKDQAWQDLHRLTKDEDLNVRWVAAEALASAFSQLPDTGQAWQDLHRLTKDEDRTVRCEAALVLGPAFSQLPDKDKAWQDFHGLTKDEDSGVRWAAALALGQAFSQLPDKDEAWQDLHNLTQDENCDVRVFAYHSLGRVSVLKATETADKGALKREMESAVAYFEKSTQEKSYLNPAKFCHPFYRTYLVITFQEANEDEVQRYIAEARKAVGRSKSKVKLLKAVENLARALRESQRLKDRSFKEIVNELNTYRLYCEKAAEYMDSAEEKAPGAVKLMRRCNLFLEDRIKATIAEIQEKARQISPEVDKAARCLSLVDPIKVHQCCMRMAFALRASCIRLPDGKRELTCGILSDIEKEEELSVVLGKIELAMAYTLPEIEAERKEMIDRLKNIEFSMAKLNLCSGSARHDLFELKTIIKNFQDKTEARGLSMEELSKVLIERDNTLIERLQKMKEDWLLSVEKMAQSLPNSDENEKILKEIQSLKQSRKRDALGITGDISSIAGLLVSLIGLAVTLKPA